MSIAVRWRRCSACPRLGVDDVLAGAKAIVVLEDIVDHANVGAIFRTAAAMGFDAVLLSPRCADPLYRRSIKVAMGAVFSMPWTRLPDWYDALPSLSARGFTTVALTLTDDSMPLEEAVAGVAKIALVWGPKAMAVRAMGVQRRSARHHHDARGDRLTQRRAAAAIACYVTRQAWLGGPARREVLCRPIVLLRKLLPIPVTDPVTEDRAEGVVGLVLQAPGQQSGPGKLEWSRPARSVPATDAAVGSGALDEGTREGQAALFVDVEAAVLALGQGEHRIADDTRDRLPSSSGQSKTNIATSYTDLAGGQADPVGGVHRGHHVRCQRPQVFVVRRHGLLNPVHHRGAPAGDRSDRAAGREQAINFGDFRASRHGRNPRWAGWAHETLCRPSSPPHSTGGR